MLLLVAALLAVGCSSQETVGTTGTSAPPGTSAPLVFEFWSASGESIDSYTRPAK